MALIKTYLGDEFQSMAEAPEGYRILRIHKEYFQFNLLSLL